MRSKYNLVMSILGSITTFIFLILSIVFHAIDHNILAIVFSSIFYLFIITYFIFNSIYYGTGKKILIVFTNISSSIFTSLILIYFLLLYNNYSKWIYIGIFLLFLILEIILDSFDKLFEFKYLFSSFKLLLLLFLFISYYNNIILLLGIASSLLFYSSRLLGRVFNNRIIYSYDFIALVLFGIFYIFV